MIPLFKVHMPESVMEPLKTTLFSGYIGQGPRVEQFEAALAPWVGSDRVLAVNSGTSAIHLALRLAGVGPGDEVITTPMTCTATNEPIVERGARIVWADIDPHTGEIDPDDVEGKITTKTKAIIAVHWGGYPCNLAALIILARLYGVTLIEDAAHAFQAHYRGDPIGSHSHFVCFSFQAIKHLTTGDGGALVCHYKDDYERAKLLRWFGIHRDGRDAQLRCEHDIKEHGYKFQMNDIAATIGLEQLKGVGDLILKHRHNASIYMQRLEGLHGLVLPKYRTNTVSSYWFFPVGVDEPKNFISKMADAEIMVSQVHSRNDAHTMFKEFRTALPGVDQFVRHQVAIPVGWWLTEKDREHIIETIRKIAA